MLAKFNVERLDSLLYDFYKITGLTVSVWDAELNQLSHQPKKMCAFCSKIRETPEGAERCFMSDRRVIMEAAREGRAVTRCCHAGLLDTAVPIKYKDSVCGYMMFGQVRQMSPDEASGVLSALGSELGIDPALLLGLYSALDIYDEEKIRSAGNILKATTRYLWLSEYIEVSFDANAAKIDAYVMANIKGDLSVSALSQGLGIPKNRLYAISHELFGMPIGDYVAAARISEAKRLLNTTDLSVGEIAAAVGIADYNYFTKFFRKSVGLSPRSYRRAFPFGNRGER